MVSAERARRSQIQGALLFLVVMATSGAVLAGRNPHEIGFPATAATVASAQPTVCGERSPSDVGAPTTPVPAPHVRVLAKDVQVSSLTAWNGSLFALDRTARTVTRYATDGRALARFSLPFRVTAPSIAVDPDGNAYIAEYPDNLVKFDRNGQVVWKRTRVVGTQIDGVFALRTGADWQVGATRRGGGQAVMFDAAGASRPPSSVTGMQFSPTPDGGVVATDAYYVRRYDSGGELVATFGDSHFRNDPRPTGGPFHFYLQGGAVLAGDGGFWVADDARGIESVSPQGFWRAVAPNATLGGLTEQSPLVIVGSDLYYAAGGPFNAHQNLSSISLSDLAAIAAAPGVSAQVLGYGAGLVTKQIGQYFPDGVAPSVDATFDPWWANVASGLRLVTTVRSRAQADAATWGPSTTIALPNDPARLAAFPVSLPPTIPGAYEVDARLVDASGAVVGATCLRYTVGAPGNRLDLGSLPAGADFGGPAPARNIALADELGTDGSRAVVPWAQLLPDVNGPFNWAATDAVFRAAAAEAASRHATWWVLAGDASPTARALVANGTWQTRVAQLAAHYRGVVTRWEAWNEPNNNFGSASDYVNKVLAPFARAVRSADPDNQVLGGSVLGMDLGYWRGIVAAGGLASMDVAAVHPYTGHNRSWEEEGTPRAIQALKALLAKARHAPVPVWDTESAWWSDGSANIYSQGDSAARALIWTKSLGLGPWNYFTIEGGYGDYGLSYSLVQSGPEPDDYVKPSALATMTVANQLDGRAFVTGGHAGTPHVDTATFGPRPGATADSVTAVWSDDLPTTMSLTALGKGAADLTVTDEYGASTVVHVLPGRRYALPVGSAPQYVRAPEGTSVVLGPTAGYGVDFASRDQGAVATASSALTTNPPSAAIDGISDANSAGDLPGLPAWASACGDPTPTLTITLPKPRSLNRIVTTSHSLGSVVPGLRDYTVEVQRVDGSWRTVDRVHAQFGDRRHETNFDPTVVAAFRVTVTSVNYGGMANGAKPYFWPTTKPQSMQQPWCGPAVIEEVEAYSGAGAANVLRGNTLRSLGPLAGR